MQSNQETEQLRKEIERLKNLVSTIERGKLMWEATFDVIADPVVVVDANFFVTRANKAFARACGLDVRDVISKKCHEVFAGCERPCSRCPLKKQDLQTNNAELEMFYKTKKQYVVSAFSLDFNKTFVLHYRDITQQQQLQRQLVHNEKMAAIGRLAEGVAHEINNPLGAILAFTQIAERALDQKHPCCDDLREIEMATFRCQKIVGDLLNFARQSPHCQKEETSLTALVQKTLPVIRIQAKQVKADVQLHLDQNLPMIFADAGRLEQVLLNLVTNAAHSMSEKGGVLTISTFVEPATGNPCLQVKDTGVGMSQEVLNRIFEPYFTTRQQGEGSGLGLSISHNIVQEHGGRIEVESQEGAGTTMTVVLPAGGVN